MKKLTSLLLALVLIVMPLSIEAFASETDTNYDDLVAPCYTNLSSIGAGISEGVLGFVTCTSEAISVATDKTFVLTCYLQRTSDSGWENYKSTSDTFSDDTSYFAMEKNWFAPAGYAYRTYTKLEVKNSSGTIVETATKASSVLYK